MDEHRRGAVTNSVDSEPLVEVFSRRELHGRPQVAGAEGGLRLDVELLLVLGHPPLGTERLVLGAGEGAVRLVALRRYYCNTRCLGGLQEPLHSAPPLSRFFFATKLFPMQALLSLPWRTPTSGR